MSGSLNKYLTSPKLKRRLKIICNQYGKAEYFDDVYQEYCKDILEGKRGKQTLDQFFKDYSRKKKWINRSEENKNILIEIDGIEGMEIEDKNDQLVLYELSHNLKGSKRIVLMLKGKWGFTNEEIAELFDVTNAVISRMINELRKDFNV